MSESSDLHPLVTLRPATVRDCQRLLEWANDPDTRRASFSADPIDPDEHRRWLDRRLAEPDQGALWIGRRGRRIIGVFRVDKADDGVLEVGIALDPSERGLGRSRPLLHAGLSAARAAFPEAAFRAWIRRENVRSLALFRGAGFVPTARPAIVPRGAPPDAVVLTRR